MDEQYLEQRLKQLEKDGSEYVRDQRLILSEIKRLNQGVDRLEIRFNMLDVRLSKQEIRAGMWGAVAGMATIIVTIFLKFLLTGTIK